MANRPMMGIGIVLLLIGFLLLAANYATVQNFQTTLGQIGRFFNRALEARYEQALMASYVGGFLCLVGFILLFVGGVPLHRQTRHPVTLETRTQEDLGEGIGVKDSKLLSLPFRD